ncbi:hypothetical protein D0Z07_6228 [Hyphodiscus hymeniophilus]|uniref:Uncharacterized protein n=1 Tax=Hyphodiscus hymeniophilus TaxID=353542 RepID=A0A9P7AUK7_9HELO|nr:hypothetical protein D0Z07_6228 [Hyphodiscus hymeniophilus]
MPSFNGILLEVISQRGLQVHPEFKHPDSSQYSSPQLDNSPNSEISSSKSDRILGRQSTVAVYIPSVSGARFWLRYSLNEAAVTNSPWFYSKLFMNGRHITSWGANSTTQDKGQIMRGLFDPSERWSFRGEDGVVIQNGGCEIRPFFFAKEHPDRSAAEEGGLIEVTVFRAQGRKRRMPKSHEFRSQDQWGIVLPTGGLLEKPEDARFYDWHLRDPKDRPFATFQFHYRSWDSLISSQLIPADHSRKLLPASPSLLSLNGHPHEQHSPSKRDEANQARICVDEFEHEAENENSISSTNSDTPWMTTVFDDNPDPGAMNPDKPAALFKLPRTASSYPLRQHSVNPPISKFAHTTHDGICDEGDEESDDEYQAPIKRPPRPATPGARATEWTDDVDRPLPELPTRTSSLKTGRSRGHSRASSTSSSAVSITPSLRSYFDRDSQSPEPPFIGVASVMHVVVSTFDHNDDPKKKDGGSASKEVLGADTRYDDGNVPLTASQRPQGGVYNISNVTLRKHHRSSPMKPLSSIEQSLTTEFKSSYSLENNSQNSADIEDECSGNASPSIMDEDATTVSVSESEWMCRTPSPAYNGRADHVGSPGIEKNSMRNSLDRSVLRNKAGNVGVRASEELEDRSMMAHGEENGSVKLRGGNWI